MAKRGKQGKRSKFVEASNSGLLLYLKFICMWATALAVDFVLDFRVEYLWPCWLLLRSLHESYRCQGLVFVFAFLCVGVTSDFILYTFVPAQWLLLLASSCVWIQFVWSSERGLSLPTLLLWLLFAYFELTARSRRQPLTADLCRPLAAHSLGQPIVEFGFGCRSFVLTRCRLKRQREVQAKNGLNFELLDRALGLSEPPASSAGQTGEEAAFKDLEAEEKSSNVSEDSTERRREAANVQQDEERVARRQGREVASSRKRASDSLQRLETDLRRLRSDLQSSRSVEAELRSQLTGVHASEKQARTELCSLRQDNDSLQSRLQNLAQRSQMERSTNQALEKKLQEERKARLAAETALDKEKRAKDELVASVCSARHDCSSEHCRSRRHQLECELKSARREAKSKEEALRSKEAEVRQLSGAREDAKEREVLMTALNAMKDKNAVLDEALRDENKMKQDLLSALHKARRDIDLVQSLLQAKEREANELRCLQSQTDYWSGQSALGYSNSAFDFYAGPIGDEATVDGVGASALGYRQELTGEEQLQPGREQ